MYLEAIKLESREIFNQLRSFKGFYLAGGTALALQIGHRISVDFDLFYPKDLPIDLLDKAEKVFKDFQREISVNNPEQLTLFLNETALTFVKYPFPVLFELIHFEGLKILSIKEIAAAKAYVIGRRATLKDYIDLYFIVKEKHSDLEEIIQIAEKKFGREFNSRLFLEQLIYLKDVPETQILFLKDSVSKQEIEKFFRTEIKKIKL